MDLNLEALGITKEDLQQRVVEAIVERTLNDRRWSEYGDEMDSQPNSFRVAIEKNLQARIDASIAAIAEKHVLPNVTNYLEEFCIQETNGYGEKRGAPVTFVEYLVAKAKDYLAEPVDYFGKTKKEGDYQWRSNASRVVQLIHSHLQNNIETAMKEALGDVNKSIAQGLYEACRIQINKAAADFRIIATGSK